MLVETINIINVSSCNIIHVAVQSKSNHNLTVRTSNFMTAENLNCLREVHILEYSWVSVFFLIR